MKNYADYNFYKEDYKGGLSDDLFSSLIVKASRIIDSNVNKELTDDVINSLKDNDQYKLKYVACELCDFLNINGSSSTNSKVVSSISIDGVSIDRQSKSEDRISKDKYEIISELPLELTRYI